MFLEILGKFSSRPFFFFSLLLVPFLAVFFFLFVQISHFQCLEDQFEYLKKKAERAYEKKERKDRFLARYKNSDPFYLDHQIESHRFLQSELNSLKQLFHHPAITNKAFLSERIQFLSGEKNRIAFTEEAIRTSSTMKETEEKQRFPIQMDEEDLKQLLTLIEDLEPQSEISRPQFLIRDFRLKKKLSPIQTQIFEVEMELLKREFL